MESVDIFRALSLVIVWAIPAVLVLAVVAFMVGAPVLTLGGAVLRLYNSISVRRHRKAPAETRGPELTCSVDADCPSGFVCVNGYCVPKEA